MTGNELQALRLAAHNRPTPYADMEVRAVAQHDRAGRLPGTRGVCAGIGPAASIGRGPSAGIVPVGDAATQQQGHS